MSLADHPYLRHRIEALVKGRETFARKKARKAALRVELAVPVPEPVEPDTHGLKEIEPGIGASCRPASRLLKWPSTSATKCGAVSAR